MDEKTKRTRKGQWTLLTELTETEKAERAAELATLFTDRGELAEKKRETAKQMTDQITALDQRITEIVAELKDGMHPVLTDVETVLDDPTDGIATVYRVSDRKVLEVRPMTPKEQQPDLFSDDTMDPDDTVHRVQIATPDEPEIDEDLKDNPKDIEDLEDLEELEHLYDVEAEAEIIEESTEEEPAEEEEPATEEEEEHCTCMQCGGVHPRSKIYHVSGGKALCEQCLLNLNTPKTVKLNEWLSKDMEVTCRANYGFGVVDKDSDCTCFRFRANIAGTADGRTVTFSSWGNHIYIPGHYRIEDSRANIYLQTIRENGVIFDDESEVQR